MGIFIQLKVSKRVLQSEWRSVYAESLKLVRAFPLYEKQKRIFLGEEMCCGVPTEEREWFGRLGWHTIGDSVTFQGAEDYFLPRDLSEERLASPESRERAAGTACPQGAGRETGAIGDEDILMSIAPVHTDMGWEDERYKGCFELWGNKTQGENYHIYLLAIACMIEDRLEGRALVYGDITRGQCVRAVELANQYLEKPVRAPARCDPERLYERVRRLPLRGKEALQFFLGAYLGKKDAALGAFIRARFSEEEAGACWQARFAGERPDTLRYERTLHEYLTLGFGLEELCRYANLEDGGSEEAYRAFVEGIMKTELFLEEKDCVDWLEIDPEEERPYGIYTLLAQFAFAGARNRRVERFIPLEQIQTALRAGLGARCDVDALILGWLEKEERRKEAVAKGDASKRPASDRFKEKITEGNERLREEKRYDIGVCRELIRYRPGDTLLPALQDELFAFYHFYQGLTKESRFRELMEKGDKERGLFIIRHNESVLLMEDEWRRIFTRIREDEESFERYYPMVRVRIPSNDVATLVRALVLNDELYAFCQKDLPG